MNFIVQQPSEQNAKELHNLLVSIGFKLLRYKKSTANYFDNNTVSVYKNQKDNIDVIVKSDINCHIAINKVFKQHNFGYRLPKLKEAGNHDEIVNIYNMFILTYNIGKGSTNKEKYASGINFSLSDEIPEEAVI